MALQPGTTIRQLQGIVCEVSRLPKKKPVDLIVAGCSPSASTVLSDLFVHYKAEDGFLYVTYVAEKTLGPAISGVCFTSASDDGGTSGNIRTKAIALPTDAIEDDSTATNSTDALK